MLQRATTTINFVRLGILALPVSGLLTLVGLLGRNDMPNPRVAPKQAAEAASSGVYVVSQFVGNVLGLTLLIFGVLALTVYLAGIRGKGVALAAMILSVAGIAPIMSAMGVTTYALPVLGRAYLNGQQDALQVVEALFGKPLTSIFFVAFLLYTAGFILFGVAIWRSGVLPKGASISVGIHAPLFSSFIQSPPGILTIVGSILFIFGGTLIALTVFRKPSVGQAGTEAEPSTAGGHGS
jgi:hypothetical protein